MSATEDSTAKIDYALVEDLAVGLCESFDVFALRAGYEGMKIDPLLAWTIVISWIKDMERHSRFHHSPDLNHFKQAGYLMYWIAKIKPISSMFARPPASHISSKYLAANEEFAVFFVFHLLKMKVRDICDSDMLDRFIYSLYYRDSNAKSLVSQIEMLYKIAPPHLRR
jgi:hypothetical protein